MRYVIATVCVFATLFSPLLRQAGAATLIARAVETSTPVEESDNDLEAPVEELDDGEDAAVRLPARHDLLPDPRSVRLFWGQMLPQHMALVTPSHFRPDVYLLSCGTVAWPSQGTDARHAWLQVFLF